MAIWLAKKGSNANRRTENGNPSAKRALNANGKSENQIPSAKTYRNANGSSEFKQILSFQSNLIPRGRVPESDFRGMQMQAWKRILGRTV